MLKKPKPFRCSGPAPKDARLKQYRTAQKRALAICNELGWPISMGLTFDADHLAKELRACIKTMASTTTRERGELSQFGRFK